MATKALEALRKLTRATARGPGRPKLGESRHSRKVGIRVTESEYKLIEEAAAIERRDLAAFCRLASLDAAAALIARSSINPVNPVNPVNPEAK